VAFHPSGRARFQEWGLEPEMWTTVWINVVAWGALFAAVVLARYHGAGFARRVEAALVRIQEKTLQ